MLSLLRAPTVQVLPPELLDADKRMLLSRLTVAKGMLPLKFDGTAPLNHIDAPLLAAELEEMLIVPLKVPNPPAENAIPVTLELFAVGNAVDTKLMVPLPVNPVKTVVVPPVTFATTLLPTAIDGRTNLSPAVV